MVRVSRYACARISGARAVRRPGRNALCRGPWDTNLIQTHLMPNKHLHITTVNCAADADVEKESVAHEMYYRYRYNALARKNN